MQIKIGLLSPFLPEKDGIAIYSDNILRGLGKYREFIVTIGRQGSKADCIVDFKSISLRKELERIIKKENLSLIHIQYVPTLFGKYNLNLGLIAALNLSVPVIVTLHEVHYLSKGLRNKILSSIEKRIVEKAAKVIVHTPNQKKFLEHKCKTGNIATIYHGLRLDKMPKRKNNRNILCFGMISHGKGVPYLIGAMKYLPAYNLTIAGNFVDKATENEVRDALKRPISNIETEFKWINEEKKEKYFKKANIVVLPHIWAPYQSGVLHNAVQWGLPVVATKAGALHEMAELFKFGEVVEPKNPKALAEGIKKVFKNYRLYEKGIIEYRTAANWPKIANEHLELYKKVINKK